MLIKYFNKRNPVFLPVIALSITLIMFLQYPKTFAEPVNDTNLSMDNLRQGLQYFQDSDRERDFGNQFKSNFVYDKGCSVLNKELPAGKNINFKNYKLKLVRTDDIGNSYFVCNEIEGLELIFEFGRENGSAFWIDKKDFTDKSFIKLLAGSKTDIFTGTLQIVFSQPKLRNTGTYYNYYYNKENGKFGLTISSRIVELREEKNK